MCLILFAWKSHPKYKLVLAGNRDEFYERPTSPLDWWEDENVLAGRDLKAGGTWMGLSREGKFCAITNFRDPKNIRDDAPSRGHIVSDYLENGDAPGDYLGALADRGVQFNGFNLLAGTADELHYYSNYGRGPELLSPGVYGLSNHLLDTPWPKVQRGKEFLQQLIRQQEIRPEEALEYLLDPEVAPDDQLPDTGIPLEWERAVSAPFIRIDRYGTRCSSLILVDHQGQAFFYEKGYVPGSERQFPFPLS